MGLLNLPDPLFALIDGWLALLLPAGARLVVWAALAGAGTLLLYRLISPQAKIREAKCEARAARQALQTFDGELSEAAPLMKAQFTTAFRHLGLVIGPTLVSMLPLVALLSWLETSYARDIPSADSAPEVRVIPSALLAEHTFLTEWLFDGDVPQVRLRDERGEIDIPLTRPVPVVEQRRWWNWLIANPLGYLPGDRGIERVEIALPQRSYFSAGPPWMRSWLSVFLPVMVVVSLLVHRRARIA
jgi:hypothetical protein